MGEKSQEKREDMVDDTRQGRSFTWYTDENVDVFINLCYQITLRVIAEGFDVSLENVH